MSGSKAASLIRKIANTDDVKIHICKVDSVTGSTCDATPVNGDAPLKKVRLNAVISSDSGLVITPVKNSVVIICEINKADSFVSVYSEIEAVSLKIGDSTLFIKDDKITLNGGENYGLAKVEKLMERFNAIERSINGLKNIISTWSPIAQDGGASLKLALATWYSQQLSLTDQSQIENDKVLH